jgi:hypothetical protein
MEPKNVSPCPCLEHGPQDTTARHYVGCDETAGRFADVTLTRCGRCGRLWLRYQLEYEGFSGSGRWAETPIDENAAAEVKPETAAAILDGAPWYRFGGSYYEHAGKRGRGRLHWGL